LDKNSHEKIFTFLSASEIAKFMLTKKSRDEISEVALRICSSRPFFVTNREIGDDFFSSPEKGYCREMRLLDLSGSSFSPTMIKKLPALLVGLSLDDVTNPTSDPSFVKELLSVLSKFKNLKKLSLANHKARVSSFL